MLVEIFSSNGMHDLSRLSSLTLLRNVVMIVLFILRFYGSFVYLLLHMDDIDGWPKIRER